MGGEREAEQEEAGKPEGAQDSKVKVGPMMRDSSQRVGRLSDPPEQPSLDSQLLCNEKAIPSTNAAYCSMEQPDLPCPSLRTLCRAAASTFHYPSMPCTSIYGRCSCPVQCSGENGKEGSRLPCGTVSSIHLGGGAVLGYQIQLVGWGLALAALGGPKTQGSNIPGGQMMELPSHFSSEVYPIWPFLHKSKDRWRKS